jgi:hypothetical protein
VCTRWETKEGDAADGLAARPNERQEKPKLQQAILLWWGEGKRRARLLWLFGLEGRGTWEDGVWDWYRKQQQRKLQRWLLDSILERN